MRMTRVRFGLSFAVIFCQLLAATAGAQTGSQKAPVVRISTALGHSVVSNYIEPSISLGEDAYVFAIAVDVDRNVQVLHPNDPDISVRMTSRRQLYLPRFFAGFGPDDRFARSASLGYSSFDDYESGYSDTRGTLIALASRKPFNLSAILVGGNWDLEGLRQMVIDRAPYEAASLLARYLGARGEPIGRDVYRFAGSRQGYNAFYQNSSYYQCAGYYGAIGYARAFTSGYSISYFRAAQLRQAGYVVQFLGIDACGQPRFVVYPHAVAGPTPGRQPAVGAFPEKRLPVSVPRNPTKDEVVAGRILSSRPEKGDRYTDRDMTSVPPTGRVAQPERVVERFRPPPVEKVHREPASGTFSERPRVPVEAAPAPRAPDRVSAPVYIPERISAPRAAPPPPPPPPRIEREKPAPPPVVDG